VGASKRKKGRIAMKYGLGSLLLAGGLVPSFGAACAESLILTSPTIPDDGMLAIKKRVQRQAAKP